MRFSTLPAAILLIVALTAAVVAGALAQTQDFQVNGFTPGNQANPAVAAGAGGTILVVWESGASAGTDSDGMSIQGRLLAADGTPLTDDFQVNTVTTADQLEPAVAATPGGDFVVVWRGRTEVGMYVFPAVHLQRVYGNGAPAGGEFVVGSAGIFYGEYHATIEAPGVAAASDGGFMVVWYHSFETYDFPDPAEHYRVWGRTFAADGSPLGSPVTLASGAVYNGHADNSWVGAGVVAHLAGNFLVAWPYRDYDGYSLAVDSVQARVFTASGSPAGEEFLLTDTPLSGWFPPTALVAAPEGPLAVTWDYPEYPTSPSEVWTRPFSADGELLGPAQQVNTLATGLQANSAAAPDPDAPAAGYVVVWDSEESGGSDTWGRSIQGRRLGWDGTPVGDDFQVNTFTLLEQDHPAVSGGLAVWASQLSAGDDTSQGCIQGQFLPGVAQDGLLGWWQGEGSGSDSSGQGNHAALDGGAGFASAVVGHGFRLDGVDDALTVPDAASLDLGAGDFSFTCWIRTAGQYPFLVDKRAADLTGLAVYLQAGEPGIVMRSGGIARMYTSETFVADQDFHAVAITVERTAADGGRIYVDGELSLTFDPTWVIGSLTNEAPLVIGRRGDAAGGDCHFDGVVDDVRLYGRKLTEAEVRYLAAGRGALLFADDFELGDTLSWTEQIAR